MEKGKEREKRRKQKARRTYKIKAYLIFFHPGHCPVALQTALALLVSARDGRALAALASKATTAAVSWNLIGRKGLEKKKMKR